MKTTYFLFFLVIIFSCNSNSASEQEGEANEKNPENLSVVALDDQRLTATYANPRSNQAELLSTGDDTKAAVSTLDGEKLYTTYCAGCHGADLSGNSATALIKTEWTYGRTKGLMNRNISYGIPGTDMAAFNQILSDDQTRNVVDYIHNSQGTLPKQRPEIPTILETNDYRVKVETFAKEGLETPWAIAFVNENKALLSEKKGQLRWLINQELDPKPIAGTPPTHLASSTGGYMDIALDPAYDQNGWVYLAYSYTAGAVDDRAAPALTKIVRGKIKDDQWVEEETLFEVPPSLMVVKGNRWGCRFLFDQEGKLLFTIGDMAQADDSQDLTKATGKVFRINPDGTIPAGNPFVSEPGVLGAIYTIGNRNVQGLDIHPQTGKIWASEHGPMGGDELNILKKGANYGWPVITYGLSYSGDQVSAKTHQEGMEQPLLQWTPSIGVCPITFVEGDMFAKWQNDLLVGALAFEELRRYVIKGEELVGMEMLLKDVGRVRDIQRAPDGSIYVILNKPDVVLRLSEMREEL